MSAPPSSPPAAPPTILAKPVNHPLPLHPSLPLPPKIEISETNAIGLSENPIVGLNVHKIYVGNLPEITTLLDLQDCFGQIGECTCALKRGFGFVDYLDPAHAVEAVAKYHEGHFLGAQIKVEISHAKSGAKPAPVNEDGRVTVRNPPGSDRPSDTRKPMHINGPPGPPQPFDPRARLSRKGYPTSAPYPSSFNAPYSSYAHPPPPHYREDPYSAPYPPASVRYDRYDSYPPPPPHHYQPAYDYDPYSAPPPMFPNQDRNRDYYPPPQNQNSFSNSNSMNGRGDAYYDNSSPYYPPLPSHGYGSNSGYAAQIPVGFDRYNNVPAFGSGMEGGYGGGYDEPSGRSPFGGEERGRRFGGYGRREDGRSPRERRSMSPPIRNRDPPPTSSNPPSSTNNSQGNGNEKKYPVNPSNGRPISPPLGGGLRDYRNPPVGREGEYNPRR